MRESRSGTICLLDEGILCFRAARGVAHDEHVAAENLEILGDLVGGEPTPTLVDMRHCGPVDLAARRAYASAACISAQALLVGSPFTRIVAALFMKVSGLQTPARIFTSEEKALQWLRGFIP